MVPRARVLMKFVVAMVMGVVFAPVCFGQIRYEAAKQEWMIDAGEMTYVVGVNDRKMIQTMYWGGRLAGGGSLPFADSLPRAVSTRERSSFDAEVSSTPLEYPAWGAGLYTESALKATFADGNRDVVLVYDSHKLDGDRLELVLKDTLQPLFVHLYYEAYPKLGVLARWSRIENRGTQAVMLEQAGSAEWNLPAGTNYTRSWLTGRWSGEWQLHTEPMRMGETVQESRRGSTSHVANPWFAIGKTTETTEENGPVWFGALGWSGSWKIAVEGTNFDTVKITGGYNPFDFGYKLAKGESLETPKFYGGYTAHGNGGASRVLHTFQREAILPDGPNPKVRPIIYNSWEATGFDVNEAGQLALAERASALGVERFVIDDGWFGARNTDKAGLGDWQVNPTKFPHGLKPVIDRVHALGMSFGLWFEPEMVNPDSNLYRAHPDWVLNFKGRQRTEGRNQLVLNLARPDVKAYVLDFLEKMVSENDIAFIKWDYNRNWAEPGWDATEGDRAKEVYVRYVANLYDILAQLRKKHPGLEIEDCSGGGGRVDLGILKYTDEVWPSDNTDALDRLAIQDGFTHAYAPQVMVAWVTDLGRGPQARQVPLQFRFLVAMQGALGIGSDVTKWTQEEMALGTKLVALYKTVRTTVQQGALYRLREPISNGTPADESSVEYVGQDGRQAVVLAYLHSQHLNMPYGRVRLRGLEAGARYRVTALDARKYRGEAEVSGAELMGEGVQLGLVGDYDSTVVVLERE